MLVLMAAVCGVISLEQEPSAVSWWQAQPAPHPGTASPSSTPQSRVGEMGAWISEEGCVGAQGRTCRTPDPSLVLSGQDRKAWEGPQDHPALAAIKLGEGEEGGRGVQGPCP